MEKEKDDETKQVAGVREVELTDGDGFIDCREIYLQNGWDKVWYAVYKQVNELALTKKMVIQLAHSDIQEYFIEQFIECSDLSEDEKEKLRSNWGTLKR